MRDAEASQTGSTLMAVLRNPRDPEAWRTFVDRYGPQVYGWCRHWGLQDADAENVTADVLLKLSSKMRRFVYDPAKGSFRGWLKTVTGHALADSLGAASRMRGSGDSAVQGVLECIEARKDLQQQLNETFDLELLEEASSRIRLRVSRTTWKAFSCVAIEGRPQRDVAKELDMTIAALYMVKSRVQKLLKEEIRKLERKSQA